MLKSSGVKIVATLGPSITNEEKIEELINAGVSMFRVNSSHSTPDEHKNSIDLVRKVAKKLEKNTASLLDLQGPKIRVGNISAPIELIENSEIQLQHSSEEINGIIPVDYSGIANDVKKDDKIYLDDGKLELRVLETDGKIVKALVIRGGLLKPRKGLNLPGRTASLSAITKKDIEYIKLALEWKVDYLALSFVRTGEDVLKAKHCMEMYGGYIPIIAKIEKPEALDNIDDIIKLSDGVMVARGDLGIEISPEKVPAVQKKLISESNAKNKIVIVATQMLETMIEQPIPTRAETSDVANAIIDGADAIMLSGETAVGKYPVEAVKMMSSISENLEQNGIVRHNYYSRKMAEFDNHEAFAMCQAMITMLDNLKIKAILAFTTNGYTPALLSKAKPSVPIYALAKSETVCRQMNLCRDVIPINYNWQQEISNKSLKEINKLLIKKLGMKSGDKVIMTGVIPYVVGQTTNFIKLLTIES